MCLTNRQLFFFVFLFTIPFVTSMLPKMMADSFGTGAWIYLTAASLFYSVFAGIIAYLGFSNRGKTLFEYSPPLVGKFLTYCFSLIYFVNFFIYTSTTTRSMAEIIHAEVMVNTPRWVVMAVTLAAAGYAVSKGLTNLGRIFEIMGILILTVSIFTRFLTIAQGDVLNLLPVMDIAEPKKYVSMVPSSLFLFSGFELMTIIPFTKRNGRKVMGTAVFTVLFIGFFYIFATETTYMILGVDDCSNYNYPLFTAVRRIDVNALQFLKRGDLIFIITWITEAFCNLSIILFATVEYARKMLAKQGSNFVLAAIGILAFAAGLLPSSAAMADSLALHTSFYLSGFTMITIPLIFFIMQKVKKHEKNISEQP